MIRSLYVVGIACAAMSALSACSASRSPSTAVPKQDVGPPAQIVRTEPPEYRHIPQGAWSSAAKPANSQSDESQTVNDTSERMIHLQPMTVTGTLAHPIGEDESEDTEGSDDQ